VENIFGPAESNLNWGLPQDYGGGNGFFRKEQKKSCACKMFKHLFNFQIHRNFVLNYTEIYCLSGVNFISPRTLFLHDSQSKNAF